MSAVRFAGPIVPPAIVATVPVRVIAGIAISFGAVSLWTAFALSNRNALRKRPTMDPRKWTAMMMIGGALEIALFIPLAAPLSLLNITRLGIQWSSFGLVLASSFVLAAVGSIGGSWAWTIASKKLPIGLAGQLIVTETVFATSFGLVASHRWPTFDEAFGIGASVCGVVIALKVLHSPAARSNRISS